MAGSAKGSAGGADGAAGSAAAERRGGRFSTFVRVSIALQTVAIFFQAVTSGIALSAQYGETLHSAGARGMYAASMLYVLAAVLAWRPGGASARPILYSTGFLLLASLQVVLGIAHVMGVHIPLGVLMFGLSLLDLGRVAFGRPRPAAAGHAASLS
ncbi:hypothetical protein ACH4M4_11845 [Streptomyces sp. NPDC017254]|uniref:hypothetical protein n=1 Tax=unclassified Streptomyces TaxID=2593676 RepID=UPI00378AA3FE